MAGFAEILDLFDYDVPRELVAQAPVAPRDAAKLLVYRRETGAVSDAVFRDIGDFLPPTCVLVLNETKVVPARLSLHKPTGGAVSILILGEEGDALKVLADRRLTIGDVLIGAGHEFRVTVQREKEWLVLPSFPAARWMEVCEEIGEVPLPPYIKETPLTPAEQRREYQSVLARTAGSIAAPTASLHFTEELLDRLRARGFTVATVTLHVHLGTFAPLTEEQWKSGALHVEHYEIPPATASLLEEAKRAHRPIIAVGTTVVRTLESASDASGRIIHPCGTTDLFIKEGYRFHLVDGLITNFHVPRSSLLMLVSALTGREKLLGLYRHAVAQRYRFFSFGDAMLVE